MIESPKISWLDLKRRGKAITPVFPFNALILTPLIHLTRSLADIGNLRAVSVDLPILNYVDISSSKLLGSQPIPGYPLQTSEVLSEPWKFRQDCIRSQKVNTT